MFCPKCGHEMIPNGRFCTHCGVDVQSMIQMPEKVSLESDHPPAEVPKAQAAMDNAQRQNGHEAELGKQASAVQEVEKPKSSNILAVVGKNQAYYRAEFEKIDAGQKTRFNWAAFLLGPGLCFYRKCEDLFKKYFSLSLILYFVGLVVETVGVTQFDFTLMAIGGAVIVVSEILMFVNSIRFGLQFNQLYHKHCKSTHPGKFGVSLKNMVIYYVVVAGLSMLIFFAGAAIERQQYAGIFGPDTSTDDPSGTITSEMPEGRPSTEQGNTFAPAQGAYDMLKDFIGIWEDGNGRYLYIDYKDELKQEVYVWVSTEAGEFITRLTPLTHGQAGGQVFIGGGSEPSYSIDITSHRDYLEAEIYYLELDLYGTIEFVPADPSVFSNGYPKLEMPENASYEPGSVLLEEPRDSNGIPYSEYNLYVCQGTYVDYDDSIIVTLTVLPSETEFSCDLFWIHGKFLEQGTVRPGIPAQLSGGTIITLDLYQGISAHVLLEGDDLFDGPYSIDLIKTS